MQDLLEIMTQGLQITIIMHMQDFFIVTKSVIFCRICPSPLSKAPQNAGLGARGRL